MNKLTKLEKKRFEEFKKQHPDAKKKYEYPLEVGYYLYAISKKDNIKQDITDLEFMVNNI